MKAYQVFARMGPDRAVEVLGVILEKSPAVYTQAVAAASVVFKARPRFLMKQSPEKRAQLVRQALSRVSASELAEEVLAAYFLEARRPLLVEWLDALGLEHEEGVLAKENPEPPAKKKLAAAVAKFRKGEETADRELLLEAFAAQSAIDWPELDALVAPPARDAARGQAPEAS